VDHRTAREDSRDKTARAGNRGHEGQNMTARTGQPGQDNGAGILPSQDNYKRAVGLGTETEQPRKVSLDKSVGQVTRRTRDDRTARTCQLGQNSPTVFEKCLFSRKFQIRENVLETVAKTNTFARIFTNKFQKPTFSRISKTFLENENGCEAKFRIF
jgi:hypothetical protein